VALSATTSGTADGLEISSVTSGLHRELEVFRVSILRVVVRLLIATGVIHDPGDRLACSASQMWSAIKTLSTIGA
jgi:hypothetical protein